MTAPPARADAPPHELVTVRAPGAGPLPRRSRGHAADRVAQLTSLLGHLLGEGATIDALAFRKSLEARAPASVKALANDPACYAGFCARARGRGLPADEPRIVAYLEDCEARGLKPASVARRLASLAVIHGVLGVPSPTRGGVVRDALRGFRRRVGVAQRQAGPLRFGDGVGDVAVKGFTLSALLAACPGTVPGLRDAALLSLAYDTGLRVSELVRVAVADIAVADDGSAVLGVPGSKTDQAGAGAYAWLSPDTVRRVAAWQQSAGIVQGRCSAGSRYCGPRRTDRVATSSTFAALKPPKYES